MFDHLYRSLYFHQIRNWLDVFPREQLLVYTNEEFRDNPQVRRRWQATASFLLA